MLGTVHGRDWNRVPKKCELNVERGITDGRDWNRQPIKIISLYRVDKRELLACDEKRIDPSSFRTLNDPKSSKAATIRFPVTLPMDL